MEWSRGVVYLCFWYQNSCRLILVGQSLSRVIDPLRSRCMAIRVAAPKDEEVCEFREDFLMQVCCC